MRSSYTCNQLTGPDMRSVAFFIVGAILATIATVGIADTLDDASPFQLVSQDRFLKWPADAQATYLQGASDALTYVTPDVAVGDGLSRCYAEAKVTGVFGFFQPVLEAVEDARRDEPLVAVLRRTLVAGCGDLMR